MTTVKLFIIFISLLLICTLAYSHNNNLGLYEIVEVFDGDTIAVNMAGKIEKVRLIGVDTPETKDPRKPVQCYGPEASLYSHAILDHAKIKLISDPLSTNRDRYDRLLRYVYLKDGTLYNQKLLESGNARAYTGFPFSKSDLFIKTAKISEQNQVGLWGSCKTA